MPATPLSLPVIATLPAASRALLWSMTGLQLWRRAPFKLFLLCMVQLLVEGLLQCIPWVGVALSKLMVPLLAMGVLMGLHELAQGRPLRGSCLLDCLHGPRFTACLGIASLWGFAVFGVLQGSAWLVYGWPAVDAVLLGHALAHRELMSLAFDRVLMLPGMVPWVLLLLAPSLLLFRGLGLWSSIRDSMRLVWRSAPAFGVFLLLNLAFFALIFSMHWTFILVLIYLPWSIASTYAVWSDMSHAVPVASA